MKLSTKFLSALSVILLLMTVMDVIWDAQKSTKISHNIVKEWTFLFAENVRVSLNTLMREGQMDIRFALFKSMQEELHGLENVRVIRAQRTNDIFMEVNKRDVIPPLAATMHRAIDERDSLNNHLAGVTDEDKKEAMQEEIEELDYTIDEISERIKEASQPILIDKREEPRDELDHQVLETGKPIYHFVDDDVRVLIPYTARRESCSEKDGCHVYAKEGDVLGAISMQFSLQKINEQIRENNLNVAAVWGARFIILMVVIVILLSLIITNNLQKIVVVFNTMAKGDFSVRAAVNSGDEIGQLAEDFNKMASSLEDTRAELDQRLLEIYALYNVSKTLNASFETEQLLIKLVEDISKNMDISRMMVLLPDKHFTKLEIASHTGFTDEEIRVADPDIHKGIYALVTSSGVSQIVEDIDNGGNILPGDIFSPKIGSLLAVPFLRRGAVLGLICAFRDRPKSFQFSDLKLFHSVAEHLAIAMENAQLFEKTKQMAITDGLTGLYNKRFFLEIMHTEVERAKRCEHDLSFIIMDIDNFKNYNDTNGHPAGDTLLKELSELIKGAIRKVDIPCRYGGEEFVVILPETSKHDAKKVAEKLVSIINSHHFAHAATQPLGFVSVSMGLATFPQDDSDKDGLIIKADEALYSAKTSGKNRVVLV
ncbi:MAG: diguanylate cyclase [Candidatus Polarisedimenticolaceae bacterium]|nr:diguanylate cyclase [Candidatus Polarisedimenticolaceae bacterium]